MKKFFLVAMCLLVLFFSMSCEMDGAFSDVDVSNITATAEQKNINYSTVHFEVAGLDNIEKIVVQPSIKFEGEETRTTAKAVLINKNSTSKSFDVDFDNFGKFYVNLDYYSQGRIVKSQELIVGVVAEEYNVALLNASFPVLYFSMSLWNITNNAGKPVPTYVALERSGAYDWSALPEGVRSLPTASSDQITSSNSESNNQFGSFRERMDQYISDLHELRPESKFNLYCTDNYPELILDLLVENGIEEDNYTVKLLSDGSGSYYWFNMVFNNNDPRTNYNAMKADWLRMKNAAANGESDYLENVYEGSGTPYQVLEKYAYVIANEEPNVEWWIARTSGTLLSGDADFLSEAVASSSVIIKSINTMLTDLITLGVEDEFKNLYSFNDDMFGDAVDAGKKVMLILGTKTQYEYYFEDYVNFVENYYGDSYAYYYKGHPGTPTGLDPAKQNLLDTLGLTDVESSIAAELILFFYPDIYLSGYPSTTFQSVQDDEMACTLFNTPRTSASSTYSNLMDIFITHKTDGNYLVEYNDSPTYTTATWDPISLSLL